MSYVNFKEEKYTANKQLLKRKKNNDEINIYLIKHKDELTGYYPNERYSYKKINNELIGKKGTLDEIDFKIIQNEDIICSEFLECDFMNLKFKNCKFIGCKFYNCNFASGGVIFENCILIKEDTEKTPSLNKKDNLSCIFYDCNMYIKFLNSDISFNIFERCNIKDTSFEQSNMKSVIIKNSELNMITIEDCDFSGVKILETYIKDLDFTDNYKTKFDEKTFFDKINPRENTKAEYEGIYMTYETIANKFKENTLNNNFGEYYYQGKCMQRKSLEILPKLESYLYWLTCGYGERVEYAVFSSLAIILIFAVIYLFTGIAIKEEPLRYTMTIMSQLSVMEVLRHLNEVVNLSVGMFCGVGFNNAQPTELSYMVSNIEMIIGFIMMGVLIGTLTRKLIR